MSSRLRASILTREFPPDVYGGACVHVDFLVRELRRLIDADVVHSHTWYANMAGHWAKLLYDVPHVVTAHSLEPQRPWKAEQLGGGYRISSWAERTAYLGASAVVAVSEGMAADVRAAYPVVDPGRIHVIYNGIDAE